MSARTLIGLASLTLAAAWQPAPAQGTTEDIVSLRPFLLRALALPPGSRIEARLTGPLAEQWRAKLGQRAEIFVSAGPVSEFRQPGCKRIAVQVRAPAVSLVREQDAPAQPLALDLHMNLCPDGTPPVEGMDLSAVGDILGRRSPAPPLPLRGTPGDPPR